MTLLLPLPRLVMGGDQTEILREGYWPSYNVPFYEEVCKIGIISGLNCKDRQLFEQFYIDALIFLGNLQFQM